MRREVAQQQPTGPDEPSDVGATLRRRAGALCRRCALAAVAVYAAVNAVGLAILRSPQPYAYRDADLIIGVFVLGGLAMIALYTAFCCFGARARGWSGWLGASIAAVALGLTYTAAFLILFQNANHTTSYANPARVYDNRAPMLFPVAFVLSALVVRGLPLRRGSRAVVTVRAEAAR